MCDEESKIKDPFARPPERVRDNGADDLMDEEVWDEE